MVIGSESTTKRRVSRAEVTLLGNGVAAGATVGTGVRVGVAPGTRVGVGALLVEACWGEVHVGVAALLQAKLSRPIKVNKSSGHRRHSEFGSISSSF
jgi:hypothetical protein